MDITTFSLDQSTDTTTTMRSIAKLALCLTALGGTFIMWKNNAALLVCDGVVNEKPIVTSASRTAVAASSSIETAATTAPSQTPSSTVLEAKQSSVSDDSDDDMLVQQGDFVYLWGDWDGAPVVLEEQKLLFFTSAKVGCTVWKQLFRRIMGASDWKAEATRDLLPWNPELNGLKYLYDYNRETATEMMTSPEWTRALFVREPKERLLSAYLDKGVSNSFFMQGKCCPYTGKCTEAAKESLTSFFKVIQTCEDGHWRPQHRRMENKYFPFLNFIGSMDNLASDAARMLQQVGAWDAFGATGWGQQGNLSIFESKAGGAGRKHATHAKDRMRKHFTPELERQVEAYYKSDYANPVLNLTRIHIFEN